MPDFSYASEKFSTARRALMLPHTKGEAQAIADAFHECSLGLHKMDHSKLDSNARLWVEKLEAYMDTTHVADDPQRGRWWAKANVMSVDEKLEIARLVDELASWFHDQSHGLT